jgi:hypothetical protein
VRGTFSIGRLSVYNHLALYVAHGHLVDVRRSDFRGGFDFARCRRVRRIEAFDAETGRSNASLFFDVVGPGLRLAVRLRDENGVVEGMSIAAPHRKQRRSWSDRLCRGQPFRTVTDTPGSFA